MRKSLWEVGMNVVRREMETHQKNMHKISKELNVAPSTVTRWLSAERGVDKPNSKHLDAIFRTYKVTMREVIMELLPEDRARVIIEILDKNPDLLFDFCNLILEGDRTAEKLKEDIAYYKEEKQKK